MGDKVEEKKTERVEKRIADCMKSAGVGRHSGNGSKTERQICQGVEILSLEGRQKRQLGRNRALMVPQ